MRSHSIANSDDQSSRRHSQTEGPFLRALNAITVGVLWSIGVSVGFATIVSLFEASRTLLDGVLPWLH